MTQKFFTESIDTNFFNPGNWSPFGVPQAGDSVGGELVAVTATGVLPSGLSIEFDEPEVGRGAAFLLQDATIPVDTRVTGYTSYIITVGESSLRFAGAVVNDGTISFLGDLQSVTLPSGTTLTNEGTINVFDASPRFVTAGANISIVNDGLIRIVNPADNASTGFYGDPSVDPQVAMFGTSVSGTGTLSVSVNSGLEFAGGVSSGQAVQFVGGANAGSTVQIDQPSSFAATIGGFVSGDMLRLATTAFTSFSYVASSAGSGTLQIFDGGSAPVASLQFSGQYAASNFNVSQSGSSVTITTNVTDATTGSTAAQTSSAVFRFFDQVDGTHFYTASVAERDTVLVFHPEMTEESNGFGAVTSASNATIPVYRFFDTAHGTHFFTASAAERDQVIATRTDLTYEPSATFLEDATAQAGDVAVYRLFSRTDGTHLYTSSAAELATLTMPGAVGYRADLVSEGVSFYAPSGAGL